MLKRILILTIATAMMALAIAQTAYAAWLTGWSYRKKITIDNTKIDDTITNFPVRVYLNADSDIGAAARSDGFDIRFTEYNGVTLLKYEREDFAIAASQATGNFWVKIPTIGSTSDTEFYIYYGKSDATDGEDAANVWTNGQVGVWLAKEGSGITAADSTSNNNDGTLYGDTAWTTGQIDGALSFDGTGDYVGVGNSVGSVLTVSIWAKSALSGTQYWVGNWDGADWIIYSINTTVQLAWNGQGSKVPTTITANEWHHVVLKRYPNEDTIELFVDGDSKGTGSASSYYTVPVYIGCATSDAASAFNGQIDNVMIFNRALSAEEIKADYNSGNNSLLSFGAEDTEAPATTVEMRGGVTLKQNVTIKTQ